MTTALTGTRRKNTYGDVLQLGNSGAGVPAALMPVRDGLGVVTAFSLCATHGAFAVAPPATANRGLLSFGAGPFDGTTSGFFVGVAAGTHLAINAASGFTGYYVDLQQAGVRKFAVTQHGPWAPFGSVDAFFGQPTSDRFGYQAGGGVSGNPSGQQNALFGFQAFARTTTGTGNTSIGSISAVNATTADNTVVVGGFSAVALTTGDGNVIIGWAAGLSGPSTGIGNVLIGSDPTAVANQGANTAAGDTNYGIAIGVLSVTATDGVALGRSANAPANTFVLGPNVTLAIFNKLTCKVFYETLNVVAWASTTNFNLALSDEHEVVLAGSTALTLSNATVGQTFRVALVQDSGGSKTVSSWFAGFTVKWPSGAAPTLTTTADKTDVFEFLVRAASVLWNVGQALNL